MDPKTQHQQYYVHAQGIQKGVWETFKSLRELWKTVRRHHQPSQDHQDPTFGCRGVNLKATTQERSKQPRYFIKWVRRILQNWASDEIQGEAKKFGLRSASRIVQAEVLVQWTLFIVDPLCSLGRFTSARPFCVFAAQENVSNLEDQIQQRRLRERRCLQKGHGRCRHIFYPRLSR